MKLIPKQQRGGSFLSLFADYNPIQSPQPQKQSGGQESSKKDKEDKGKLTEKDLFTLLKDVDGLPNEMQALVTDIQNMYQSVSSFGSDIDSAGLANLYAQNIYKLKHANFNKNEYDKAYKQVEQNEGLNEFAISTSGKMIVYDKDKKLSQVSVSEFLNNQEDYQAITNSNLLWLRAHDPSYVNNNQIFDVISNGMGINKVEELIRNRFASMGTSESKQEKYAAGMSSQVIEGFQVLQQAQESGKDVALLVKEKAITKSQAEQAQSALKYIYQTLPDNAKSILQLRSGNSENPAQGALEIIGNMIASRSSSYQEQTVDIENSLNANGTTKSKNGDKSLEDEDLNTAQMFLSGYGQKEQFVINPGTNLATNVSSNALPLVKKDGTPLGTNCSLQEVSQGQFGPILNWNNVTMGGRKIDPVHLNQIIINDDQIRSIDFPVDENGNPDLRPTTLQAKKECDRLMKEAGIDIDDPQSRAQNADKINQILQEQGLSSAYDSHGNLVSGKWRRFGVMNATADNRVLGVDPLEGEGNFLREVTDEYKIDSLIEKVQKKADIDKLSFDKKDMGIFEGGYDMFLEGTVWIPLNVNYHSAMAGSGKEMSAKLNLELEQRQQTRDRREQLMSNWVNPGNNV